MTGGVLVTENMHSPGAPLYLPLAAPKAIESLVGQSRILRFAAAPVISELQEMNNNS